MIDIHSHVLPGLDDGPADMETALEMVFVARAQGTRRLFATPHVRADYPSVTPDSLPHHTAELQRRVRERGIDCVISTGAEVDPAEALRFDRETASLASLAESGTVLLESPWDDDVEPLHAAIAHLRALGCRAVLAHPERSPALRSDHGSLHDLVAGGTALQVNATSLESAETSRSGAAALELIRRGLVHVVASDGHALDWRPPVMAPGLRAAERALRLESGALDALTASGPEAVLRGEVRGPLSLAPRRRGPWARARSRGR